MTRRKIIGTQIALNTIHEIPVRKCSLSHICPIDHSVAISWAIVREVNLFIKSIYNILTHHMQIIKYNLVFYLNFLNHRWLLGCIGFSQRSRWALKNRQLDFLFINNRKKNVYVRKNSHYQGHDKVNNDRNLQFSFSCVLSSSWIGCSENRISNCFRPSNDSLCFGSGVVELPPYSI